MISWIASKSKVEVVGLVGCGRMGRCMLESVLNAGYRTVACDAFPAAAAAAGEMGAEVYSTPAEVMKEADMVLMSLPGPAQLEAVLFGEDGMVRTATAGKGDLVTRPEQPMRQGRAFAGWFADESCTKRWDFDNDKVEDSMTLYAKWL